MCIQSVGNFVEREARMSESHLHRGRAPRLRRDVQIGMERRCGLDAHRVPRGATPAAIFWGGYMAAWVVALAWLWRG